jgi:hypothetical protein
MFFLPLCPTGAAVPGGVRGSRRDGLTSGSLGFRAHG